MSTNIVAQTIEITPRELTLIYFALYERANALQDRYSDKDSQRLEAENRELARRLQAERLGGELVVFTIIGEME